jgi:hypothetical protein
MPAAVSMGIIRIHAQGWNANKTRTVATVRAKWLPGFYADAGAFEFADPAIGS